MLDYENMPCASDEPYPPVSVAGKNNCYGRLMLDNYGGAHSEMSTISLYLYNHFQTEQKYRDIAFLFRKISIVEMHHLRIFGSLATLLGEQPRLWTHRTSRMSYWTPEYNLYAIELDRIVHNSLAGEKTAIQKYEQQIAGIDDILIVTNLERIVMDEKIHVKILEKIIAEYHL